MYRDAPQHSRRRSTPIRNRRDCRRDRAVLALEPEGQADRAWPAALPQQASLRRQVGPRDLQDERARRYLRHPPVYVGRRVPPCVEPERCLARRPRRMEAARSTAPRRRSTSRTETAATASTSGSRSSAGTRNPPIPRRFRSAFTSAGPPRPSTERGASGSARSSGASCATTRSGRTRPSASTSQASYYCDSTPR